MARVKISPEIEVALNDCKSYSTASLIADVATIYAGYELLGKKSRSLAILLIDKGYILEDAIQICFGIYEVERTPVEQFNFFYDKYSQSNLQLEKDFLGGMLAVAKWFDLPVKGRENK